MTKTRFEICLDEVLRHEGGYVDHPSDPGGATNLGITRKTLARWRKVSPWWSLPKSAVQQLGRDEAARIYRASYWDGSRAGRLPAGLDLALFDFAVNSGPIRAVKTLQIELGVKVDGVIGPLTMSAVNERIAAKRLVQLISAICDRRLGFLRSLSTFSIFGRGWISRVEAVRKAALIGIADTPTLPSTTTGWSKSLDKLNGYKTYIVAAFMLLAGLLQVLGIDLPSLDASSAGDLIMQALAVIFLRQGLKSEIGRA